MISAQFVLSLSLASLWNEQLWVKRQRIKIPCGGECCILWGVNCLVAKEKINVFSKSVLDISLILRADLCGLTAAWNAIIDSYDTRKLFVKWTSLRTNLKDSLMVTLLFEFRERSRLKQSTGGEEISEFWWRLLDVVKLYRKATSKIVPSAVKSRSIDRMHKWRPKKYSLVYVLISLTSLVCMDKRQKECCLRARLVSLIST